MKGTSSLRSKSIKPTMYSILIHSPLLQFLVFLLLLFTFLISSSQVTNFSQDFGRIFEESPIKVVNLKNPTNISHLLTSISSSQAYNNVTVVPSGNGHSTYGQAQARGGIVVNMRALPSSIQVEKNYVDVGGGALWIDILNETLKHGLSPRSWTDYLYLTVGGTLSNAGVGGQVFKYGPQISNVIELEVVTGKGEQITCSMHVNSDLFNGILGGLGQFGIITRARIPLHPAPKMVKWVRVPYDDFNQFTKDQEFLISSGQLDYLEGFVEVRRHPYYTIELAIYYNDKGIVQKILDQVLSQLRLARAMVNESDASYFDFLNRVKREEDELRKRGLWEVAHPWLNLFVPKVHIRRFKDLLLETISDSHSGGPIIIYPILKHKWNRNMSAMLPQVYPEEDVVYVASVLRAATPSCVRGSRCLDRLLAQNRKVIDIATSEPDKEETSRKNASILVQDRVNFAAVTHKASNYVDMIEEQEWEIKSGKGGMGAKQYLPYWKNQREWRAHFGDKWDWFKELKKTFDPLHILTPGQGIFKRQQIDLIYHM